MRSSLVLLASAALAGVTTAYKDIANQNGFPNPTADQLKIIGDHADGTLSNAPPPPKLNDSSVPVFQLINFNENFEVAFFASLIHNITADLEGYKLEARRKKEVLEILDTVLAQEQLHAINAAKTLKNFQKFQPDPCSYFFPATNILEAFAFAERFTDLVLGTLQDAAQALARNGDVGPVRGVASSLGQEGQQSGFYRIILKKKPSEKPFLTTNVGPFLFSFVNRYVVPGSCPFTLSHIPLSIFPALKVVTGGKDGAKIEPKTQTITFSADLEKYSGVDKYVGQTSPSLWITYFSGQLLPISRRVTNVRWEGRKATLDAEFPFEENTMIGLTVAALTDKAEFKAPGEVVAATIAAPGLIQVDDEVHNFDE